jgi:hypothetical protein
MCSFSHKNVFLMHMFLSNKEENFPRARKFILERWLRGPNRESPEERKTYPFIFMPFGFGQRMSRSQFCRNGTGNCYSKGKAIFVV